MSQLGEQLLRRVLALEIRIYSCVARLTARTDDEALHDLRIALRTLRSILRPLRGCFAIDALNEAASAVATLSGPLRDEQVLISELLRLNLSDLAAQRSAVWHVGIDQLLSSAELSGLFSALADFAHDWRQAGREGELVKLRKRIHSTLCADKRQLQNLLAQSELDWHRLRVKVKRLRYADENYPRLAVLKPSERRFLRQIQSALGDWHDRWQWLENTQNDGALDYCRDAWQEQMLAALQQAQGLLKHLR